MCADVRDDVGAVTIVYRNEVHASIVELEGRHKSGAAWHIPNVVMWPSAEPRLKGALVQATCRMAERMTHRHRYLYFMTYLVSLGVVLITLMNMIVCSVVSRLLQC